LVLNVRLVQVGLSNQPRRQVDLFWNTLLGCCLQASVYGFIAHPKGILNHKGIDEAFLECVKRPRTPIKSDELDLLASGFQRLHRSGCTGLVGGEDSVNIGVSRQHVLGHIERSSDYGLAKAFIEDVNTGEFGPDNASESVLARRGGRSPRRGFHHNDVALALQDLAHAVAGQLAGGVVIGSNEADVAIGRDTGIEDDDRDIRSNGTIHGVGKGLAVGRSQCDCIHPAINHAFEDLQLSADIGFIRGAIPGNFNIALAPGFYRAGVDSLPEKVGNALRYNGDYFLVIAIASGKQNRRTEHGKGGRTTQGIHEEDCIELLQGTRRVDTVGALKVKYLRVLRNELITLVRLQAGFVELDPASPRGFRLRL
jgi:hypothetical protein